MGEKKGKVMYSQLHCTPVRFMILEAILYLTLSVHVGVWFAWRIIRDFYGPIVKRTDKRTRQ